MYDLWGGSVGGGAWFAAMPNEDVKWLSLAFRYRRGRFQMGLEGLHVLMGRRWGWEPRHGDQEPQESPREMFTRVGPALEIMVDLIGEGPRVSAGGRVGAYVGGQIVVGIRFP